MWLSTLYASHANADSMQHSHCMKFSQPSPCRLWRARRAPAGDSRGSASHFGTRWWSATSNERPISRLTTMIHSSGSITERTVWDTGREVSCSTYFHGDRCCSHLAKSKICIVIDGIVRCGHLQSVQAGAVRVLASCWQCQAASHCCALSAAHASVTAANHGHIFHPSAV